MQFQLGDKVYQIDDADFEGFIENWRKTQRCPENTPLGVLLQYGEDESILLMTPLGKHLTLEYLMSRGKLDRNELLVGAIPYDRKVHSDVIGKC